MESGWTAASIFEYTYGLKLHGGRNHAPVLQGKKGIGVIFYVALYYPKKILWEGTIRNYRTLQRAQAVRLKILLLQIFNAASTSK